MSATQELDEPTSTTAEHAPEAVGVSGAVLLLRSLKSHGVERIFANIGTDYAPVVEALAVCRVGGEAVPELVLCQHENIAMSAAHGCAAATGELQVVFVHADVGTQNIGGAMHNASRARVPVLVIAGLSPYTTRGEMTGSRSAAVQFLQDVPVQSGIVHQYTAWIGEARTAVNIPQVVARAVHVARSTPGVAYLTMAREPLEELTNPVGAEVLPRLRATVPDAATLDELATWLREADIPLAITGATGRDPKGADALARLADVSGLGVLEAEPYTWTNLATDDPHHLGAMPSELLGDADLVLALNVDVPWVPALQQPAPSARVALVDADPLKHHIPMADIAAHLFAGGSPSATLDLLTERLTAEPVAPARLDARRQWVRAARAERTDEVQGRLRADREAQRLTPLTIAAALDAALGDEAVVLHEAVSSARSTITQLRRGAGRRFFGSGGGSLGWCLGAAFGMRLALGLDTVAIMGDGTFVFGNPTAAFWGARRYGAPFLAVVLNNAGWNAVGRATVQQHPLGVAATSGELCSSFGAPSDLGLVAQASGGSAWSIDRLEDLPAALSEAIAATRTGTAAVVDVRMEAAS